MDPETAEVRAAGCVVYRRAHDGLELALVHRPRYDDWSLPKGKLDAGEDWETAARREVLEEIGYRGELERELTPVRYADRKGRDKVVRYWLMEASDGAFEPNSEVDELSWEKPAAALSRLTYETDRETVERALAMLA
jgi:8-oxo-dGTP diphosphatase